MKDVIWYTKDWYNVIWDDEKNFKYRMIKVWNKYIIQKWFEFEHIKKWTIINWVNKTDPLNYETAIAYIRYLKWDYQVIIDEFISDKELK